ncbi:MAG: manganese-binding transcriptional regulator MntR [Pirellulales bacterium]
MPSRSADAEAHRRTRRDHAAETAQDYVEAVAEFLKAKTECRVTDLARKFGVSHVTVNRIVARLKSEGLVLTEPYRPITLTPKGKRLAEESQRRHDIVYRFLIAIGVDKKNAVTDAEGIEHHVSSATLKRFEAMIASFEQSRA